MEVDMDTDLSDVPCSGSNNLLLLRQAEEYAVTSGFSEIV